MSFDSTNDRKRKPTDLPKAVVSSDDQSPKESKARRVSTDGAALIGTLVAFTSTGTEDAPVATETVPTANAASASASDVDQEEAASDDEEEEASSDDEEEDSTSKAEREKSLESIGELVQYLSHSDDDIVQDSINALFLDLDKDKKKYNGLFTIGGGHSLVLLLKRFLRKAARRFPERENVTELHGKELETLESTLDLIVNLTFYNEASNVSISAIGGVEAVVEVMKMFPKSIGLQKFACIALMNLTYKCNIGDKKAVESSGFEVLLVAINNHLDSSCVCGNAFMALGHIIEGSEENTKLFMNAGGVLTALTKVREKWPDDDHVQNGVHVITKLIMDDMKSWI
jgi:hypothetical protein